MEGKAGGMHEMAIKEAQRATFEREELFPLIERANVLAVVASNPRWKRAYEDLAQAASVVDAFIARSTVSPGAMLHNPESTP